VSRSVLLRVYALKVAARLCLSFGDALSIVDVVWAVSGCLGYKV
jgi:hypothetical protein